MRLQQLIKSWVVAVLLGVSSLAMFAMACSFGSSVTDESVSVGGEGSLFERPETGPWIPDVVERLTPSIVQIAVRDTDGSGSGTGIVFDADGTIITNWHIVQNAGEIEVVLPSGVRLPATLMREDSDLDLALLTVNAEGLVAAEFGDSGDLRVGEDVVSIGHAFGLSGGPSVSRGVVSALDRTVVGSDGVVFDDLIQTDAAINLGSSGGALINSSGEVIGINVGSLSVGQGANFALDINTVLDGTNRLVSLGAREQPGYLGVGGVDVTAYMAFQGALPVSEGFGVRYVDPQSPAAAELRIDDIIVNIDSTRIRGVTDVTEFLRLHPHGTDVVVTAIRGVGDSAVVMEIPVTLGSPTPDA